MIFYDGKMMIGKFIQTKQNPFNDEKSTFEIDE